MNSPGRTVRLTSSTAVKSPKVRVKESMRSSMPGELLSTTIGSFAEYGRGREATRAVLASSTMMAAAATVGSTL